VAASLFTIPGCQAATCKMQSDTLAERIWKSVFADGAPTAPKTVRPPQQQELKPQAGAPMPGPAMATAAAERPSRQVRRPAIALAPPSGISPKDFKVSGSPIARVTCEVYTDYECPACARFYLEVAPQLVAEYVATGKVKLLHRDFPLPYHAHSRLAARYANAAGATGHYEVAVQQLFRTQSAWGLTGEIDQQLALVLPSDVMQKVRDLVQSDARLEDTVTTDLETGRQDQLRQTPTVVIVSKGERRVIAFSDYEMLKKALDESLTRQ
jgi:protein-disulfide isomerase